MQVTAEGRAYNLLCRIPGVPACFDPSREAVGRLAIDLAELRDELVLDNKPALWTDVELELTRRIGGLQNLGSYMSTLMATRRA